MTKSLNALAFAAVFGMFIALPEAAQAVTINGCSSPSWDPNSSTLTCGGGTPQAPSCSWPSTPPSTYTNGNTLTLTPNCTQSPTSYTWNVTGTLGTGNCATGASCTDKQALGFAGSLTYAVVAHNATGDSTSIQAVVAWADGVGVPTGCTISPSFQTLANSASPQAIAQMTVSCNGGAPATTWAWTRSGGAACGTDGPTNLATMNDHAPGNTTTGGATCTYTADVSNATGHVVNKPTASVTVNGTGGGTISCQPGGSNPSNVPTDLTKTLVQQLNWDQAAINGTSGMKLGVAWVGVLTVPANVPGVPSPANGRIWEADWGGTNENVWMTVATTPCTWGPSATTLATTFGANGGWSSVSVGGSDPAKINLTPGQTYYINVQSWNPTKNKTQCAIGNCEVTVQWYKPSGT